jgi:hypothetical protein
VRNHLITLIFGLLAAAGCIGQTRPEATKVTDFDPATESSDVFILRTKEFIKRILIEDSSTRASVNLYETDKLGKILLTVLKEHPQLRKRFDLLVPKWSYHDLPERIEFWLVPTGTSWPFDPLCVMCECPTIWVSGIESISNKEETATFTANVSGGAQDVVTYTWAVEGSQIISGQSTPSIVVRVPAAGYVELKAKVEIGGIDPSCSCPASATYVTKVIPD